MLSLQAMDLSVMTVAELATLVEHVKMANAIRASMAVVHVPAEHARAEYVLMATAGSHV